MLNRGSSVLKVCTVKVCDVEVRVDVRVEIRGIKSRVEICGEDFDGVMFDGVESCAAVLGGVIGFIGYVIGTSGTADGFGGGFVSDVLSFTTACLLGGSFGRGGALVVVDHVRSARRRAIETARGAVARSPRVIQGVARLLPAEVRPEYLEEWSGWLLDLRIELHPIQWWVELLTIVVIAAPRLAVTLRLRARAVNR